MSARQIALIATTGGALIDTALKQTGFKRRIAAVYSDRECGALAAARRHGVPTQLLPHAENEAFSDALEDAGRERAIDYFVAASCLKLLQGRLLETYRGRLFNLHASLLPAFAGRNPMGRSIAAEGRLLGNTVHVIDASIDGGPVVMQSAFARGYDDDPDYLRHRLFEQACKGLLQLVRWLADGRIALIGERVRIAGVRFGAPDFAPALDDEEALALTLPYPWWSEPEHAALAARLGKAPPAAPTRRAGL